MKQLLYFFRNYPLAPFDKLRASGIMKKPVRGEPVEPCERSAIKSFQRALLYFFLLNISFLGATPSNLIPYMQEIISEFSDLYNCVQHIETEEACEAIRALQEESVEKLENSLQLLAHNYSQQQASKLTTEALDLFCQEFLPGNIQNLQIETTVEEVAYTIASMLLQAGAEFNFEWARSIQLLHEIIAVNNSRDLLKRNKKVLLVLLEQHAFTLAQNIIENHRYHRLEVEQIAFQLLKNLYLENERYASLYLVEKQISHIPSYAILTFAMRSMITARSFTRSVSPISLKKLLQQFNKDLEESDNKYEHVKHTWPGRIIAAAVECVKIDPSNFFSVECQNAITFAGPLGHIEDELFNHPNIPRKRVKIILTMRSQPIVSHSSALKMFKLLLRDTPEALRYFSEHTDQILSEITIFQDTYPVFRVEDIVKATEDIIAPIGSSIRRFFGYSRI